MKFLQRGTIGLATPLALALMFGSLTEARAQSGPFVYVPINGNAISVIDSTRNSVIGSFPVLSGGVAVRGDESLVYVTNSAANAVSVFDTATNRVTATIAVGSIPAAIAVRVPTAATSM